MKNKILYSLMAFLMLVFLSSCTAPMFNKTGEETEEPKQETSQSATENEFVSTIEGYWHLACDNTNIVYYKNISGTRNIEFELTTSFPFEPNELTVEVEAEAYVPYETDCYQNMQEEEAVFPFYLYQCYRGMDWKHMGKLAKRYNEDNGDIEVAQEFEKMRYMYVEDYQTAVEQKQLPQLYRYIVVIEFELDQLESVQNINTITLSLHGKTKSYDFDNFVLDAEKEFEFENIGISNTIGIMDAPIYISNDGVFDLTYLELQAHEAFTLTGLSFLGENEARITDCFVTLTQADGVKSEMKWDGKTPVQVLEGEAIHINAFCKDTQLADVMEAVTSKYIMVHYLSAEGKECIEIVQGVYRMRQGLYDLYAMKEGIDVLSYYLDYDSVNANTLTLQAE